MSEIVLDRNDLLRTYTAGEFCERAGVSRRTLDRMLSRGELQAVPGSRGNGKTLRISALELARVIHGDSVSVAGDAQ